MKPDQEYIDIVRQSVRLHIRKAALEHNREGVMVLDVAPDEHGGAAEYFKKAKILTLNLSGEADIIFDLCDDVVMNAPHLLKRFDVIICTEVLEHVYEPARAIASLRRMLKNNGTLYASTPFNLRIHNPLPDLWRFTEHGLRHLFKDWSSVEITEAKTRGRELMPVHYRITAKP